MGGKYKPEEKWTTIPLKESTKFELDRHKIGSNMNWDELILLLLKEAEED